MLRKQRAHWEMVFALGAPAGLEAIQQATFDVVVTDMRMPYIDGFELLSHVRDRDPTTIRMLLSGFYEPSARSRVAPVVHQVLHKPCSSQDLTAAVQRGCAIRARFVHEPLQALLGRIAGLPPCVVDAAIADHIARDAALSARILELTRTSPSALDSPLTSIPDAVSRLGLEHIAAVAIATESDQNRRSEVAGESLIDVISTTMIALAMPEHELTIAARLHEPGATRSSLERELIGTTHTDLGAYLLIRWGLPVEMSERLARRIDDARQLTREVG